MRHQRQSLGPRGRVGLRFRNLDFRGAKVYIVAIEMSRIGYIVIPGVHMKCKSITGKLHLI